MRVSCTRSRATLATAEANMQNPTSSTSTRGVESFISEDYLDAGVRHVPMKVSKRDKRTCRIDERPASNGRNLILMISRHRKP